MATPLPPRPTDFRQPGSAPRWRIGVGASVVAVLVMVVVGVVITAFGSAGRAESAVPVGAVPSTASPTGTAMPAGGSTVSPSGRAVLYVHLLGQVARPGLYELPSGSRLIDAVTAAGGLVSGADQNRVNLARPVTDGEQVVIPQVGESLPAPDSASEATSSSAGSPSATPPAGGPSETVNLNTADLTALETLPGVGPATAQSIVDWRDEHGRFESPEDLLAVTGIGDKKFEKLRDQVSTS